MNEPNIISYFDIDDYETVIKEIHKTGYKAYFIDGKKANSIEALFVWMKEKFPLDPPLSGSVSFDAFADSLWGGLDNQDDERVAIVWKYPYELIKHDKERFDKLIQCINEVAKTLTLQEYGINKPVVLKIFLFDKGAIYSKFKD